MNREVSISRETLALLQSERSLISSITAVKWSDKKETNDTVTIQSQNITSPGEFPVCTDLSGAFPPFCLPLEGADVIVDATYYVTWNADFYPLNATVTIELRYPNSTEGDSAFTSERTGNSYGYIPLRMRGEWLQDKPRNTLTLYIIELDLTSDRRASARQGPTVTLHPKPVEHYKPLPPPRFNKLALMIGLPVSVGVVILIVAGVFFGMRRSTKIGIEHAMAPRGKGYGIGKSKNERLGRNMMTSDEDEFAAMKKYSDADEGLSEVAESELYNDINRPAGYAIGSRVARLKSWSG